MPFADLIKDAFQADHGTLLDTFGGETIWWPTVPEFRAQPSSFTFAIIGAVLVGEQRRRGETMMGLVEQRREAKSFRLKVDALPGWLPPPIKDRPFFLGATVAGGVRWRIVQASIQQGLWQIDAERENA